MFTCNLRCLNLIIDVIYISRYSEAAFSNWGTWGTSQGCVEFTSLMAENAKIRKMKYKLKKSKKNQNFYSQK